MPSPNRFVRKCRSVLTSARQFWQDQRPRSASRRPTYRPMLETFEERVVPTVTAFFDTGTGALGLKNNNVAETLTFSGAGANLTITATTNNFVDLTGGAGGVVIAGKVLTVPIANIKAIYMDDTAANNLGYSTTAGTGIDNASNNGALRFWQLAHGGQRNDGFAQITATNMIIREDITGGANNIVTVSPNAVTEIAFRDQGAGFTAVAGSQLQINGLGAVGPNGLVALDFGSGFYKQAGQATSPLPTIFGTGANTLTVVNLGMVGGAAGIKNDNVAVNLASGNTGIAQYTNMTISTQNAGESTKITAIYGGQGNDVLIGNNANNFIVGGGGAVTIVGGNGSNQLNADRTFDQSIKGDRTSVTKADTFIKNGGQVSPLTVTQYATFGAFDFGESGTWLRAANLIAAGTTDPAPVDALGPVQVTVKSGTGDTAMFGFGNVGGQFIAQGGNDVYSGSAGAGTAGSLPSTIDFEGAGNDIINAFNGDNVIGNSTGNNILFVLFNPNANGGLVTHITGGPGNNLISDSNAATSVDPGSGTTTVAGQGGKDVVIKRAKTFLATQGQMFTLPSGATFLAGSFGPGSQFPPAPF